MISKFNHYQDKNNDDPIGTHVPCTLLFSAMALFCNWTSLRLQFAKGHLHNKSFAVFFQTHCCFVQLHISDMLVELIAAATFALLIWWGFTENPPPILGVYSQPGKMLITNFCVSWNLFFFLKLWYQTRKYHVKVNTANKESKDFKQIWGLI